MLHVNYIIAAYIQISDNNNNKYVATKYDNTLKSTTLLLIVLENHALTTKTILSILICVKSFDTEI